MKTRPFRHTLTPTRSMGPGTTRRLDQFRQANSHPALEVSSVNRLTHQTIYRLSNVYMFDFFHSFLALELTESTARESNLFV